MFSFDSSCFQRCLLNLLKRSLYQVSILSIPDWLNAKLFHSFDKSAKNHSSLNLLKHLEVVLCNDQ